MKVKVNYFRAKDKATGKRVAILVNEANYMFVLQPWCVADKNSNYRRMVSRRAVNMKGWRPVDRVNYDEWCLAGKYDVEFKGVF